MEEKWYSATVIGDKVPHLFLHLPELYKSFPSAKIIFMLRSIDDVASSWNTRANDPKDTGWHIENNYMAAVKKWNQANIL